MNEDAKEFFVAYFNKALRMEVAAAIQYAAHAELITGPCSEPLMSRLQDSASDEMKHAEKLRGLIGDYLMGVPDMTMTPAKPASDLKEILMTNIESEKEAIALYKKIHAYILARKEEISDVYETLEHDIRHILMEEQEHVAELQRLC